MVESKCSVLSDDRALRMRRSLLCAIAATLTAPLASFAQPQQKVSRIGFLAARSRVASSGPDIYYEAFARELSALGYADNKNIMIEWRFADGKYERLPELAADLVRQNVDVLVTHGTPGTRAAKQATPTIPIVMVGSGDAVGAGLVTNLARPEGNVTGSTFFQPELLAKRLEILKEAKPRISRVGYLVNAANPSAIGPALRAMEIAGKSLQIDVQPFPVRGVSDFPNTFSAMAAKQIDGLVISEESTMLNNARIIVDLAAKHRIASIGGKEFADAGGLVGYGVNLIEIYRRAASTVDKILKGAKPADLPVTRPTTFELVVNVKTASVLGIKMPESMLLRADKVIT
jgi:putative tryptophan/tyrosine transport system substrate-binding protein